MKVFKIIYNAKIKLISALYIGCAQASPLGAMEMIRNGADEYIIPGTSIAGVFIDCLKDVVDIGENNSLLLEITGKVKDKATNENASSLIFRTVNLGKAIPVKIRDHVCIDREVKSAKDRSLFSYWEIEPEDMFMNIIIEIDNLSKKVFNEKKLYTLQVWVETVFSSWNKEGFFLGGHSSTGNGYAKLIELQKCVVDNEDKYLNYLDNKNVFKDIKDLSPANARYKNWKINVNVGDEENKYGTNALLIKGGVTHNSLAKNTSDGVFINTGARLFIPGSTLKGCISMLLEKYGKIKWLNEYFGQDTKQKSYFLFPDIFFEASTVNKHLINIERHAEDEFTRAIYGSGNFNEERLFYEKADGFLKIPLKLYNANKIIIDEMIAFIKNGAEFRLISLGANSCYPKITIEEVK